MESIMHNVVLKCYYFQKYSGISVFLTKDCTRYLFLRLFISSWIRVYGDYMMI